MTLSLTQAGYSVGGQRILQPTTLSVVPGEVLALVGPNGAGKTTLLRLLGGEAQPDVGGAYLDQRPLAGIPAIERATRIGILPQSGAGPAGITVAELVVLGRCLDGRQGDDTDAALAAQMLDAVDAAHLAEQSVDTLSGGERQRVHLARVLTQIWSHPATAEGPRYLLLDEPTSALDLAHQHAILRLARDFAGQGHGVLAILHDLTLAAQYADRLAMMDDGRVVAEGEPGAVLDSASIRRVFGFDAMILSHPVSGTPVIVSSV